ncbi:TIGR03826 family flagellar region protein [Paenibacillus hexagrammi]|uniref:Flagellar protein n=1 Tax=Paenibacillus hexagrammi TaxID=2908839 RepID=A0ABY3SGV9_9BACL|nr:TIGR03826 family flagellar region protein [Paenibacillus sp. YPD9-1]UJF33232.1 flagellar protein [Paenibacillus sp. YPD9-1]
MSLNVGNCPRCGRVYVKGGIHDVCPNCLKTIEMQYEKCLKYLRENRGATLNELSEATEVPVRQITKFIREGRISIVHAPNMSYPCEVCGTLIRESNMCESCRSKLVKDVGHVNEDERRRQSNLSDNRSAGTFNIQERLKDKR